MLYSIKFLIISSADSIIINTVGSNPMGNIRVFRKTSDEYIEITRPRIAEEGQERTESNPLRCGKAQSQTESESQKPVNGNDYLKEYVKTRVIVLTKESQVR